MTTLMEMPFVISFWQRVQIFQSLVMENRQSIQGPSRATLNYVPEREIHSLAPIQIRARRGYIYEDAFEKLSKENEPSLHPRLNVTFLNEADVVEMGVDGGGLSREFLNQAIAEGFNPARGFFLYTDDNTLYPNPNAAAVTPDYLKHFFFLGRLLAKAIYEGMLVELRFAHFFLAKLVSRTEGFSVGFDYLRSLDKELYRQLCMLKTYEGNVRDLELDFTTVQSAFGESRVIELKPGGSSIPVTNATRVEYVHLVANYKLNRQIYRQSKAFIAGMADVLFLDWLRLFDAEELQVLISGADMDIDVDDLKAHTHYVGDMTLPANKMTVEIFWRVVHGFTQEQKRSLLRFATACSRPPMFGFQDLQPPFSIQVVPDTERLPTSSTCMNLLKIPAYQDSRLLRSKLLYALNANAGFEYS
uniref:HECT-type E3 ubiquitin transferase n=1 Tax=Mesocestoides corti TaxID=53468 RepID=A0A5K3G2V2_MESCO